MLGEITMGMADGFHHFETKTGMLGYGGFDAKSYINPNKSGIDLPPIERIFPISL